MDKFGVEIIWKDRKRYFGLPLSFTKYSLSEDRLFISQGLLNIRDDEVLLAGPDFNTVKGAIPVHVRHPLFLL